MELKISEKYNEYVENIPQVENILNQCEYDIEYRGKDKTQSKYILFINDQPFYYYEGLGNEIINNDNKQDKILKAIHCLLLDRDSVIYCRDVFDFICEYYAYNLDANTMKQGYKAYHQILENNKKLKKFFNDEQLDFLAEHIQL